MIEFKGPTDTLEWKDCLHLTAMTDLYRIKIKHPAIDDIRLFTIASTIPEDYHNFLRKNHLELKMEMKGLYAVAGTTCYDQYILVLNELEPDQKNEVILFFSSKYHDRMGTIISDEESLIIFFLIQELYQKERRKMKFKIKDEDLAVRDLQEAVGRLPLKMRLAGLKPSELLNIYAPDEILEIFSPEERLKGLKTEELKRLKEILNKLELN